LPTRARSPLIQTVLGEAFLTSAFRPAEQAPAVHLFSAEVLYSALISCQRLEIDPQAYLLEVLKKRHAHPRQERTIGAYQAEEFGLFFC